MASTAIETPKKAKSRKSTRSDAGWWGDGLAPHQRWPGVTIAIPAVWSVDRGRWESPDGRYVYDAEDASRACDFFPTFLAHYIGEFAGQSFTLFDWQRLLVVQPAFGWKNAKTGARRFRFVLLFVAKGNGKSPLGSGLGLFLAGCDREAAAEVFALAGDKDQAKVVHDSAKVYVEESADLAELCDVTRDSIYFRQTRSFLKVISADAPGKHGRRPHGVIIDELHTQKHRDLYEALRKSMSKRRQPMMIMLSHAGDDDESICYEEYEYAKSVIKDPSYDEHYLPVIFEAAADEDWTSPEIWKKANPMFGVTINPDIFAGECRAAQNEPRKKNDFLRYQLNRWVNQATAWIPVEWWDACPSVLPAERELQKLTVTGGLDMSQKIDLAAFVATFQEPLEQAAELEVVGENEGGQIETKTVSLNYRVHLLPMFWIPENTMREHERNDRVPYALWSQKGWVIPTEGDIIDDDRIYRDILKLAERFPKLKEGEIGYDPAFATSLALRLQNAGFKVVETPQNYRHISEPSQVFEALLKGRRITHDGNRCHRWNVENVSIKSDDAGRIRPVKPKKASKRIDGVPAAIMGIGRLMVAPQAASYQIFFV
jgi:phage terminase large subunit-like protein